jgi:hypothetical protein
MQAIAEYFRDLAANDRYFGAEPATPDAAMLHRIAEREVQRMVEAKVQTKNVVVREHDERRSHGRSSSISLAASDQVADTGFAGAAALATSGAALSSYANNAPDEADAPLLHDEVPGGVAAKLARLRKAVVNEAPDEAPVIEGFAAAFPEEDLDDQTYLADTAEPAEVAAEADDLAEHDEADVDDRLERLSALLAEQSAEANDVDAADQDGAEGMDAEDIGEPDMMVTEASATEAVEPLALDAEYAVSENMFLDDVFEAKTGDESPLVLTEADDEPMMAEEAFEDDTAEDEAVADDSIVLAGAEDEEAEAEDDIAADEADPVQLSEEEVLEEGLLAPYTDEAQEGAEVELAAETDELDASAAEEAEDEELDAALSLDSAEEDEAEDEAPLRLADAEDTSAEQSMDGAEDPEDDLLDIAEDDSETEVAAEDEALAAATAEESSDDKGAKDSEPTGGLAGRLKRAHARVVRLRRGQSDSAENAETPRPTGDYPAISRLLRQADDEMDIPENRRRLAAIEHLKAAVVATEAERLATGEGSPGKRDRIQSYRDDLAKAVQPMHVPPGTPDPEHPVPTRPQRDAASARPDGHRPGSIRPELISPKPLVLVSELRVDSLMLRPATEGPKEVPPAPTAVPTAPEVVAAPEPVAAPAATGGRLSGAIGAFAAAKSAVTASDADEDEMDGDDSTGDLSGLSKFAEKLGVTSLTDLLEVAAAYTTCVENRNEFTRPQLMRRLIAASIDKPVSREDGLRSFGTLLRKGRIEKAGRGHYTLSDSSPYLAEARRITH